jgi:hypothetical protein
MNEYMDFEGWKVNSCPMREKMKLQAKESEI